MYRRCLSYLSESWPAQKSCPAAQVCPQESPILQIKILLQCMHADARDGLRTRGEGRQKVGALPYWTSPLEQLYLCTAHPSSLLNLYLQVFFAPRSYIPPRPNSETVSSISENVYFAITKDITAGHWE